MSAIPDPSRASIYAVYPLRVGLAIVFLAHGIDKLTAFGPWADFVGTLGLPAAPLFAGLVIGIELLGAVGVLLGVFTRTSAAALSSVILVAIVTARLPGDIVGNLDLDIAVLAGTVTLLVNGPGRPTLGSALGWRSEDPEHRVWRWLRSRRASEPAERSAS